MRSARTISGSISWQELELTTASLYFPFKPSKTGRREAGKGGESIIFSRVNIGRNAKIRRAIIDKGVSIPEDFRVGFDQEEDEARGFTVSPGGVVVIAKAESIEPMFAET